MPRILNVKRDGLPPGAVYIGRANPSHRLTASKWANPFKLRRNATPEERAEAIRKYEQHLLVSGLINDVGELRGKDLICWCAPLSCHGDVLLKLANPAGGLESGSPSGAVSGS
jgi:hypothetical protein